MSNFQKDDVGNYKGTFLTFVAGNEKGESVWQDANTAFVFLTKAETNKVKLHVEPPKDAEFIFALVDPGRFLTYDFADNLEEAREIYEDGRYKIAEYQFVRYV